MKEPLITLQLRLTQAEMTSLLMAQITQARLSRLTYGEVSRTTRVDRAVLEKLIRAQNQLLLDKTK